MLTTLLLLQAGYAYVPYSSRGSVIEQSKEAYYLALRQAQGAIRSNAPNWQPWLVFFLRSLAEQVRRLEKNVERERLVLATLPELSLRIVEFAREHGRVTIGEAIKLTGASRNTLKQHFRVVERGHLGQQVADAESGTSLDDVTHVVLPPRLLITMGWMRQFDDSPLDFPPHTI